MPFLNLKDADTSGFEAIPSGVYDAEIFKMEVVQTKGGEDAKLPEGTDQINVQFKIVGGPADDDGVTSGEEYKYYNRRVFTRYTIPPENYDKAKSAKMKGMLVRFLTDAGYTQEEVMSEEFDLNFEEVVGRDIRVTVAQKAKYGGAEGELDNEVRGTKPAGDVAASSGGLL